MAVASPPKTKTRATPETAVVPASLSHEDLMALLGQAGAVAHSQSEYHRMTLKAGILETDDGEMFPPRKDGPTLTVRIVTPPVYYNAFFLGEREDDGAFDASRVGRADLNGRFTRKYDDPTAQAADTNPANEVYDQVATLSGKKGTFKADIQLQIVPASGELTGDETVYTLSLSTTSVFEWRGSSKEPDKGSVSDTNFIVRLAQLAIADAVEAKATEDEQKVAVLNAMTSLRLGGVVADVYLLRAENDKKTVWTVISFDPIHIESIETLGTDKQLTAGDDDPPF